MSSAGHGTRAVVAAFIGNFIIAVAKFIGFAFTGSSSMLAEGVHSVADTGNQGLLLFGGRRSRRKASKSHAFGYGRERYFWSFVVALVLFTLGAGFAVFEGIEKIREPHEIDSPKWAYAILIVALIIESFSIGTAIKEANPLRKGRSWREFVMRTKIPELPVVLLEDMAALLGLVIALGAVSLAELTSEPIWDGIGTLIIGLLLGVVAVLLARRMQSLLIGESSEPEERDLIARSLADADEVVKVIHLRTQYLGPEDLLVAAKLALDPSLEMPQVAAAIDACEKRLREVVPHARYVFIEPDLLRPEKTP